MDGREGGFIVLHRRIQSSALWLSMRGDQRGVFLTILLLANWKPARARWKDQWYEVQRGELSHALSTIAKEANASIKVVRSTLAALMADDTQAGGNGPAVTERYPIPGTGPGTGPRVLTVVNYSKYQDVPDDTGTGPGTGRARVGHGSGTDRAQREQEEQGNKGNQEALRLAPLDAPPSKPKAKVDPIRRSLSDALVAVYAVERGGGYGFDSAKDGQALTRLLSWSQDVTEHARRFRLALRSPAGEFSYRVDTIAAFATGRIWNHFAPQSGLSPVAALRKL